MSSYTVGFAQQTKDSISYASCIRGSPQPLTHTFSSYDCSSIYCDIHCMNRSSLSGMEEATPLILGDTASF
ncbi:hypothetical protein E2C01_055152 [Portunus trituberculatus]|uniref:Uncharacterized protein n=1 Tax=Portunus trituberculatus TaxID=210409 RepID=A0A5B7GU24_PORTR|nr:hypothetical protein [Portunus trituberculatus]